MGNQYIKKESSASQGSTTSYQGTAESQEGGLSFLDSPSEPLTPGEWALFILFMIVIFVLTFGLIFLLYFCRKFFIDFTPRHINTFLVVLLTMGVSLIFLGLSSLIIFVSIKKKLVYRDKFATLTILPKIIVPLFLICLFFWAGKDCAMKEYGYLPSFRCMITMSVIESIIYETYSTRSGLDKSFWKYSRHKKWRVFFSSFFILVPVIVVYIFSRLCILLPISAMWVVFSIFTIFLGVFSWHHFLDTNGRLCFSFDYL